MKEPLPTEQPLPSEDHRGQVLALDNIALDLPIASLGSRALAAVIDYFFVALAMAVSLLLAIVSARALNLEGGWAFALVLLAMFAVQWFYFVIFEVATSGKTPGKMAVGLRVVGREGGTPSAFQLVTRNLVRPVDIPVGPILMVMHPLARRLGDRIGGTLVLHDREPEAAPILGRVPASWGAQEISLVEAFLNRRSSMDPSTSNRLARKLIEMLRFDDPALFREEVRPGEDSIAHLDRLLGVSQGGEEASEQPVDSPPDGTAPMGAGR